MSQAFRIGMIPVLLAFMAPASFAETTDTLAFFQEEAKVVTASRREQAIAESPVAIDVITEADIEASGATNLWDLMRFRPGMDVISGRSADGNRAIVSVRGFPQEFSANVLVLIDGRSVYSELDGGVFWEQLPVQLQDVKRIEIVRGPNAALFGTGAGLGVINIITKKPSGETKGYLKALAGNRGMVQTSQRGESAVGDFSYRVSHTFMQEDGFPLPDGADANDYLRKNKGNLRGVLRISPRTDLDVSAGGIWENAGQQTEPEKSGKFDQNYQRAQLTHHLRSGTADVTVFRSEEDSVVGPLFTGGYDHLQLSQRGVEALHEFAWARDRFHTTYGASFRDVTAESDVEFRDAPRQTGTVTRGFANQSIKLLRWWSLNGAFSLENTYQAGTKPAYHVANLFNPTEDDTFRLSHSVSYTAPTLFSTRGNDQFAPTIFIVGNPDLKPQKLTSYEAGYSGRGMSGRLRSDVALFYTNVAEIQNLVIVFTPPATVNATYANTNRAIARGVETGFSYRWSAARSAYINHTYERIVDDLGDQEMATRNTPNHKVNVGANLGLGRGFTSSFNLGYKNGYLLRSVTRSASVFAPAHWRLDSRLGYRPPRFQNLLLFIAGQNLERSRHVEAADGLAVARTYQAGTSLSFGGTK